MPITMHHELAIKNDGCERASHFLITFMVIAFDSLKSLIDLACTRLAIEVSVKERRKLFSLPNSMPFDLYRTKNSGRLIG